MSLHHVAMGEHIALRATEGREGFRLGTEPLSRALYECLQLLEHRGLSLPDLDYVLHITAKFRYTGIRPVRLCCFCAKALENFFPS